MWGRLSGGQIRRMLMIFPDSLDTQKFRDLGYGLDLALKVG